MSRIEFKFRLTQTIIIPAKLNSKEKNARFGYVHHKNLCICIGSAHVKLGVRITAVPLPAERGVKNGCADPNAISCFAWIDSAAILQMNLTHSIRFGLFQPGLTGNIACLYHRHFCAVEVCVAGAGFFSGKGKSLRTHARSRALLRDLQIKPNQKN